MGPLGFVAVLAGWFVTEVGRQPYVVYGLMRTADFASPIGAPGVAGSLLAFVVVYGLVFAAGAFYILRLMGRTPEDPRLEPIRQGPLRSAGPRRATPTGLGAEQEARR
jgi:cytochrome d ubiquinol oxidase subunit I